MSKSNSNIEQSVVQSMPLWVTVVLLVIAGYLFNVLMPFYFLVCALVCALAGVFIRLQIWRLGRLQVTSIANTQPGLAAFVGKLMVPELIRAPVSGKQAEFFVVTVKQILTERVGRLGARRVREIAIVASQRSFVEFSDGSESCWLPSGVGDWNLPHCTVKTYHEPADFIDLIPYMSADQRQAVQQPGTWEVTEKRVGAREALCVIGWLSYSDIQDSPAPEVPLPPTVLEFLASLVRDPLRLVRRPKADRPASNDQGGRRVLLPDPRFGVLQTPVVSLVKPDTLAYQHHATVVLFLGLAVVFAGLGIWLYQAL